MPIIQKLIGVYKIWHEYFKRFDKISKYSLGFEINNLFIEILRDLFTATHKSLDQKLIFLNRVSDKLDLLKFFIQIIWEMEIIDNKKYIILSKPLNEVGKMLGGWLKQTKTR